MLQKLVINNYAIIDRLSVEPDAHLNIVTGETGAGKSIILGALSLILGDRADTSVLINKEEKCVVEAVFDVQDNRAFRLALKEEDLDDDGRGCIIRREINSAGKSRAFINDTPVNLTVLNKLTSLLVDLHRQFGHLAFENDTFQADVVDALAQNAAQRKTYTSLFERYSQLGKELNALNERRAQREKESDYKQFLYDELAQADLREEEIEQAEQQLKQLTHAERILGVLQSTHRVLEEGEQPLLSELKRVNQQLQTIADVMPDAANLNERIAAALVELKDVAGELEQLQDKVHLDEELMVRLQERMDIGYKLLKKHGVNTTNELIEIARQLGEELKTGFDLNDSIERLTKEHEVLHRQLMEEAGKLSAARKAIVPQTETHINALLARVGMPNAAVKIVIETSNVPGKLGMDTIAFMLDANKSGQFQPIHKAASGGEMSRIMLCIKSLTAKAMEMPTLIFDEVDTGISGEAAKQVGILLRDLANYHQVICITHQPQVAAKGTCHLYVYKEEDADRRITTRLRALPAEERVLAIARMIGGEQPGEAALQNARELVAS